MYVVCVQVHVKPEFVDDFIKVTKENHERTIRDEPGSVRWDLSQSEEDPTHFFLYEVYQTKDDFPRHQQTPHYLAWKAAVADWMAEPRVGTRFHSIYPADEKWTK